jgi:hypothetical protein
MAHAPPRNRAAELVLEAVAMSARAIAGGRKRGEQLHARRRYRYGRRVPHKRDRGAALALVYPIQHLGYEQFLEEYYALRAREERQGNRTGALTHWRQYCVRMRQLHGMGQSFACTNKRTARAMELANRARCERTTRRVDRGLEAMGRLRRTHVKRGGWRQGNRDFFRIMIVHRSFGEQQLGLRPLAAATQTAEIGPPDGGRDRKPPPKAAANGSNEERQGGTQLALPLAQRAHGFAAEIEQLIRQLGPDALLRAKESEEEP